MDLYFFLDSKIFAPAITVTSYPPSGAIDFDGKVSVKNGKLVKGILNKGAFASTTEGLVHMLY
jgi:hypothetical protein